MELIYKLLDFLSKLLPALYLVLGAVLQNYYTSNQNVKTEKRKAYSALAGLSVYTKQLYVSYYSSILKSEHFRNKNPIKMLENKEDIEEARRYYLIHEELIKEIALSNKKAMEILADIDALFPRSEKLDELLKSLHTIKPLKFSELPLKLKDKTIDETLDRVQEFVETHYSAVFTPLINHLKKLL